MRIQKSKIKSSFPIDIWVYLLRIRATISVPPVVPPALKIIPRPIPNRIPAIRAVISKSPWRSIWRGIRSKKANQADKAKVPSKLE